jgi:nucleoside-diphosphate-sugar epimerase
MNKNILITGGAGFIGINIAKKLRDLGNNITIYDNLSRESILYDFESFKINFVKGDIRDELQLNNTLKNIDIVFHLAFINGTRFFYDDPKNVIDVGLLGILNLM